MLANSKKKPYLCSAFEKKHFSQRSFGEMAEWSIAAVLKTVVLRGTGGSNPSLSAKRCKSDDLHLFFYSSRKDIKSSKYIIFAP